MDDNKREDTVNRKKHFDHTLWRTRFAGGNGPTTRETTCMGRDHCQSMQEHGSLGRVHAQERCL